MRNFPKRSRPRFGRLSDCKVPYNTGEQKSIKTSKSAASAIRLSKAKRIRYLPFQRLKKRMNKFRDGQKRRLLTLTKAARESKGKLRTKLEIAEHILELAELSRKLETEQEKISPQFYQQDGERGGSTSADEMSKGVDGDPHKEWGHLNTFYKKYNKILLDKIALQKERDQLEASNAELQGVLKAYLDGISVSPSVMESENPLLVVNGRVSANIPAAYGGSRRPPVVEGNHIMTSTYKAS